MNLSIERTYDVDLIEGVMRSPEIFAVTAEDGARLEDVTADPVGECWLQVVDEDGAVVALYNFHARNSVTVEIHAHVMPYFRKRYSYETGILALTWLRDNAGRYKKVVAQIPAVYGNVIAFVKRFGFREEGVNRLSYVKDGVLMDQMLFGMTQNELKGLLDGQDDN